MCDRCGSIFSENEDGWQTFQGSTIKRNPLTGERRAETVAMDACRACSFRPVTDEPIPSLPIPPSDPSAFKLSDDVAQASDPAHTGT
jgi:hypothetical protein